MTLNNHEWYESINTRKGLITYTDVIHYEVGDFMIQPRNNQVSKKVVHEIKFKYSCHENLNNLWCSYRYFKLIGSLRC